MSGTITTITNSTTTNSTITNSTILSPAGTIESASTSAVGVSLAAGGTFSNPSGVTVSGEKYGVESLAHVYLTNAGTISGSGTYGVGVFVGGGEITNTSGAEISGNKYGIQSLDSFYLTNSSKATISGGTSGITTLGNLNAINSGVIISLLMMPFLLLMEQLLMRLGL